MKFANAQEDSGDGKWGAGLTQLGLGLGKILASDNSSVGFSPHVVQEVGLCFALYVSQASKNKRTHILRLRKSSVCVPVFVSAGSYKVTIVVLLKILQL